ncbi:serine/threonine kinase family protein [Plesiocystis pacifica SIR-1]|uniref:Serine/threonine kinase family protein n=1 Tax=Plesiocystis pacifica SIR-1 TaxID=391625 RepID=A6GCB0_9BACT|nr:serine/threonine-protein kinase [Plesiocystis pacifica]EDM76469.1 serine/threonine kinase family protein [Plesiocystis pacifica SIR-1]
MAIETTLADDSERESASSASSASDGEARALSSGQTLPKLEAFDSPLERQLVLDGVLSAMFSAPNADSAKPESTGAVAARIGRYSILRKVGQGGMGVVLLGYDEQLHRKAAIKLLRASRSGPEAHQRMLREAQGLARLSHPNVVQVYEGGIHEDTPYIAMEFIEGQTLSTWLRAEPRPSHEAIAEVFRAAGRGLAAAHAAGLVHRDFKPDNVMIAEDGQIKVMDFGLARAIALPDELAALTESGAPGSEAMPTPAPERSGSSGDLSSSGLSTPLTRTGALLGTPAYMSPEQFATGEFDARSDQFSFCVALWEALFGARPFRGRNLVELSAAVSSGRIETHSADVRIPTHVERALRRGLAVDPDERWSDMGALLDALAQNPTQKLRRWGLGAGLVATVAALALSPLARDAPPPPPELCPDARDQLAESWNEERRAALHARLVEVGGAHGARLSESVIGDLDAYADAWVAGRRDACEDTHVRHEQSAQLLDTRVRCLDGLAGELASVVDVLAEAQGDLEGVARVVANLAPVEACSDRDYLEAHRPIPADPETARAVRSIRQRSAQLRARYMLGYADMNAQVEGLIAEAEALGYEPVRVELLLLLGELKAGSAPAAEAREVLEEAMLAAVQTGQDLIAAEAATNLTYVVGYRLFEVEPALRLAALAHAWQERFHTSRIARARLTLNEALALSRSPEAEHQLRVADKVDETFALLAIDYADGKLQGTEQLTNSEHFMATLALNIIAIRAYATNDVHASRTAMLEVLRLRREKLIPGHTQIQLMEINLGGVGSYLGRWVEAEARLLSVREDVRARSRGRPQDLANLHINLSEVMVGRFAVLGEPAREAAVAQLTDARTDLVGFTERPGVNNFSLDILDARLHRELGDLDGAQALLDRAGTLLAGHAATVEIEPADLATHTFELARLVHARGDRAGALELYDQALADIEEIAKGPGDPEVLHALALHCRAALLHELGRDPEALELAAAALARWTDLRADGHPRAALTLDLLAILDPAKADAYERQAEAIRERLRTRPASELALLEAD